MPSWPEPLIRERARAKLRSGTLPARRPDRSWGGLGIGLLCAVCEVSIKRYDREVQVQFEHQGAVPGLDTYHFDPRCFAVWELERHATPERRSRPL